MPKTSNEATAVAPHESFALLSKNYQLSVNPKITEHLHHFYSNNNMLSLLNTLIDAHSSLLEVNETKLSKTQDDNIHLLVNFVSTLTHFQIINS